MNELETPPENVWDFLKVFVPLSMLFALVWRWIDKSFKDKADERTSALQKVGEEAGKAAAKEVIKDFTITSIVPMQEHLKRHDEELKELSNMLKDILMSKKI